MNPYAVLGVDQRATDVEIRHAYLALARRFHPDTNPGGEERMRAINEAWAILGDPGRRTAWDRRSEVRDVGFVPDDPIDDGIDPRTQPDVPYRRPAPGEQERRGLLTMAPVALFATAVAAAGAGVVFDNPTMLGVGVVVFSVACLVMVGVLLVAMVDARHDEG